MLKITKRLHVLKSYDCFFNVQISNSVNPQLQLKDTESVHLLFIDLLSQLKGFKFTATLVSEFQR